MEPPIEMRCPVCGSTAIVPGLAIADDTSASSPAFGHDVLFLARPESFFDPGAVRARLSATLCGRCGYTMFFAQEPGRIWQAYSAAKRDQPEQ